MNTRNVYLGTLIATYVLLSSIAIAAPVREGERIVRDPQTGDYTAYYLDDEADGVEMIESPFITATKIDPRVRSAFMLIQNLNVRYVYNISNGYAAKQPISDISVFGLPANVAISNSIVASSNGNDDRIEFFETALSVPNKNWYGSGARLSQELNIGWHYNNETFSTSLGIQPGETLSGFGTISTDLPGILGAHLIGNTKFHQFDFSGEGPDPSKTDIARQMQVIEQNDFVSRNIAAPLIIVPNPFDAAIVLDRIRTHVATWTSKQLVDSVFASQLDGYLGAAANAFRNNQPKAGREHIESLRKMLGKEHRFLDHDDEDNDDTPEHKVATRLTIDRLAARVLDFDLRYVLKQMEKENKHEHDHDEGDRKKER
ncbi:MAG: hypothetical protein KKH12_13250 [Gammaproteobacteria bacterium]|nr:hypothetical protein [Gammaproteobacteria bacterium]MBU1482624.1 hypothetical protein [Gammaproteobacteria bacterium]